MPITASVKREYEFIASDLNNDPCIFPRNTSNSVFVQAFDFKTKNIAREPSRYLAFPFVVKLGSTFVGLHSNSDSHAAGTSQFWIKSEDDGVTWTTGLAYDASSGVFDTSFLNGLIPNLGSVTLKVWSIQNNGGVLSLYANPTQVYGGITYALWSRVSVGPGGVLFRTGYGANGADTQTALFQSSDGGQTWTGKSVIFSTATRKYNEADIVNVTGTTWLAIVREDSGAANSLYSSTSTDGGVTWSAPTLLATTVNGRQPNLTKLTDGSIILATGDRFGVTGYSGAGDSSFGFDTTGITVFKTTDGGVSWGFRTRVSPIYSTDGGQPMVVETSTPNSICCVFYTRKGTEANPIISSVSLSTANL